MAWTTQGTMEGVTGFRGTRGSVPFSGIKSADGIVEGAETVTRNYCMSSGTPVGGAGGRLTVPTASGEGVKVRVSAGTLRVKDYCEQLCRHLWVSATRPPLLEAGLLFLPWLSD